MEFLVLAMVGLSIVILGSVLIYAIKATREVR